MIEQAILRDMFEIGPRVNTVPSWSCHLLLKLEVAVTRPGICRSCRRSQGRMPLPLYLLCIGREGCSLYVLCQAVGLIEPESIRDDAIFRGETIKLV